LTKILPFNLSKLTGSDHNGRVAQLGEHRPYKPGVAGSNPVPPIAAEFTGL
jgi:hypothetical protein